MWLDSSPVRRAAVTLFTIPFLLADSSLVATLKTAVCFVDWIFTAKNHQKANVLNTKMPQRFVSICKLNFLYYDKEKSITLGFIFLNSKVMSNRGNSDSLVGDIRPLARFSFHSNCCHFIFLFNFLLLVIIHIFVTITNLIIQPKQLSSP